MSGKLNVTLPTGWADYSKENPDGPATYLRDLSEEPGALQLSVVEYRGGEVPDPAEENLVDMACGFASERGVGELVDSSSGECAFGIYGTAVYSSEEFPRFQVWYLSDGRNFILATHICSSQPDSNEVEEAKQIVLATVVGGTSGWKFW